MRTRTPVVQDLHEGDRLFLRYRTADHPREFRGTVTMADPDGSFAVSFDSPPPGEGNDPGTRKSGTPRARFTYVQSQRSGFRKAGES